MCLNGTLREDDFVDDLVCKQHLETAEDEPPLVMETCSKKGSKSTLFEYVRDVELRGKGDQKDVFSFILYKYRQAVVSQVVTFLLDRKFSPVRQYVWWDRLSLFLDRFRQFKALSDTSLEKQQYWINDWRNVTQGVCASG